MKQLELMTTEGCHLCDLAVPLLVEGVDPRVFSVDLVDIVFDDHLMQLYAEKIPVLVDVLSQKTLDWPFNALELEAFLAGLSPSDQS